MNKKICKCNSVTLKPIKDQYYKLSIEALDLSIKIEKLNSFLSNYPSNEYNPSDEYTSKQIDLMRQQKQIMMDYRAILYKRADLILENQEISKEC